MVPTPPRDGRRDLLTVIASIKAAPGEEAELKAELQAVSEPTSKEDGYVNNDLRQGVENPSTLCCYTNWESAAQLDAHLATPHVVRFAGMIGHRLDENGLTITRLQRIA